MHKRKFMRWFSLFFMLLGALLLVGCRTLDGSTAENLGEEEFKLAKIDMPREEFQKVVGWLSNEEVLVHHGKMDSHMLSSFNIFTGKMNRIIEEEMFFLTIDICPKRRNIFVQKVNEEENYLSVYDRGGQLIAQTEFHSSNYVTINWNPADSYELFFSYYDYTISEEENTNEEAIVVEKWELQSNSRDEMKINSLNPKWYSRNLFLYVEDEFEDLYIGDIRTDEDHILISRDVSDFYLYEDTFISVTASDINESEIYLFHEFPFMVYTGAIALPKVGMNNQIVSPYFSQTRRNGDLYAVAPGSYVQLDYDLGTFVLVKLDFSEEEKETILPLPENAPIELSPDEKYLLFGWQLEKIIVLEDETPFFHMLMEEI